MWITLGFAVFHTRLGLSFIDSLGAIDELGTRRSPNNLPARAEKMLQQLRTLPELAALPSTTNSKHSAAHFCSSKPRTSQPSFFVFAGLRAADIRSRVSSSPARQNGC
ncbi:hypothetical protein [Nocardia sp. R6R-6]|uniref:hypothetical protein n=1 Tax=Nocardia sp. R6R-6 TaxID=3459303 RepID=UPI00403DFBE8